MIETNKKQKFVEILKTYSKLNENEIKEIFEKKKKITCISFAFKRIRYENLNDILNAIENIPSIKELNLAGNIIHYQGLKYVLDVLTQRKSNVETLNLSCNNIYNCDEVEHAFDALKYNEKIKELNISTNFLVYSRLKELMDILKENKTLKILNFSNNSFLEESIESIFDGLKKNKGLEILDLGFNDFFFNAMKSLSDVLKVNNSLTTLIFSSSNINKDKLHIIVEGIKKNRSLKTIKLDNNQIEDESLPFILDMLRENETLKEIDLSCNLISNIGVEVIFDSLFKNKNITSLTIDYTIIDDDDPSDLDLTTMEYDSLRNDYSLLYKKLKNTSLEYLDIDVEDKDFLEKIKKIMENIKMKKKNSKKMIEILKKNKFIDVEFIFYCNDDGD